MKYLILFLLLVGCNAPSDPSVAKSADNSGCRGTYSTRDPQGDLHKWNEYYIQGMGCVKEGVALTRWESSTEHRRIHNVHCTPQNFTTTLVSANNYYSYRDGRIYLDLNGSTGEYRRISLAEGKDGKQLFTKLQGCFYVRNDATFGQQLLLDAIDTASSQEFDPMEIFSFTTTATTLESVRFDDSADWDYRFCPADSTPWGFCDLLKNGNVMFFPVLSIAQQASLLAEALLIGKQFNYANVPSATFESLWSNPGNRTEDVREDYKYDVQSIVDIPNFIDQAYAAFVRGERPTMPDTNSLRMPIICWAASRDIVYSDGSKGKIHGQACYENNQYTFTQ